MLRFAFLPFIAMAALIMTVGVCQIAYKYARVSRWPSTAGTIDKCILEFGRSKIEVIGEYSYVADGAMHTGRSTVPPPNCFRDRAAADARCVELRQSAPVVYFNPSDPSESELSPWRSEETIKTTAVAAGVLVFAVYLQRGFARMNAAKPQDGAVKRP